MTVGERIRQKRIEMNLTQDELAKKAGYKSRSSINKIESSRDLPLDKIEKVAKILDCTPTYLMGWEDNLIQIDTDAVVDIMAEERILEYAKRLMKLSKSSQQTIFDNIDFLLKKEGRD